MKPRPERRPRVPYVSTVDIFDDAGDVRPLEDIKRDVIALAMARYGSVTAAASVLKIGRSNLYRRGHKTDRAVGGRWGKPSPD